jgi:hypothetical protein
METSEGMDARKERAKRREGHSMSEEGDNWIFDMFIRMSLQKVSESSDQHGFKIRSDKRLEEEFGRFYL